MGRRKAKEQLELRQSGIQPVGAVPWGTHFCQFYQSSGDLVETLVPYFRAGLESNESCMWVTSAPLEVAEATAALRMALPDLDDYLAGGQAEILDYTEWCTRSGRFEPGPVLQGWVDKLAEARRRGFDGLRLSGNTFWLEQESWDDFTHYEETVNQVIGEHRMIALCTYSLERCGVREILDVASNHQFALVKRLGRWEIIDQTVQGRTGKALVDKRTEEKLTWLASFPQRNPTPVIEVDLESRKVTYANPAARDAMPDLPTSGLEHPWLDGAEVVAHELEARGLASTTREVELGGSWSRQTLTLPGPGRLLRVYAVDITDRVRADQALEAARVEAANERRRLEAVMEALPVGVAMIDAKGGNTSSNRAFEEVWRGPRPQTDSVADYAAYKAWWVPSGRPVQPEEWASAQAIREGATVVGQLMEIERFDGTRAVVHNSAAPIRDAGGRVTGSAVAILDVTELRRKEQELERVNERLVWAQRAAGAGIWDWELATERLQWSPELFRLFGLDPATAEATFETWHNVLHPADRQGAEERLTRAVREHEPLENVYRVILPGGAVRWITALGDVVYDEHGNAVRMAGICVDVTERRQDEERIRAALKEKEVLLREIHHRVKNNLQIIASMLNLQLASITDQTARAPFVESQNRVRTIALIHEKLYGSKDFTRVSLRTYLPELAAIVHRSFGDAARRVRVEHDLEDIELDVGTAIPVALISNELLSNAFKHAFPAGREGRLVIGLHVTADGCCELSVADDGVGLPADVDLRRTTSLGLQLVSVLTTQLHGTMQVHRDSGTRFVLSFKPPG